MIALYQRLTDFKDQKKLTTKGKLAAILYITRKAKEEGLPLVVESLVTDGRGQILGLGKAAVQTILKDYGITKVLAEEAGRTSRGSLGNMSDYVSFLNDLYHDGIADMDLIESWWIDRINDYFAAQPLILKYDTSKSLQNIINDLLKQAIKRQKENPGMKYAGAVLQHLVGAKLAVLLGDDKVMHNGFSVADAVSNRTGDFVIDDFIIHVTTAPSEALIQKCIRNLESGAKPIIVTISGSLAGAFSLVNINEMQGRIDIFDIEQFIATNVYEWSRFKISEQKDTLKSYIEKYNEIIDTYETDPSLRVSFD